MTKTEVEALLREFDEVLVQDFPGPEPMSVLLVGGACLLLQGITAQPTDSVEVIIFEMLGSQERTLVFHSPTADKIRRIIREIGKRRGLKGERQQFFHDDSAPFLLELSEQELPPMRLLTAYRKLHLYAPRDIGYLLACKLMLGRPGDSRYCRPVPDTCDPEPGTGAAACGSVLPFSCSPGRVSVALHIGEHVQEMTSGERISVVRRCLLCYAVRGAGLL